MDALKADTEQEKHDFIARHLYEMTADIVMSLLILDDATRSPELFGKSARNYVRYAEADFAKHALFVANAKAEDLSDYRQV